MALSAWHRADEALACVRRHAGAVSSGDDPEPSCRRNRLRSAANSQLRVHVAQVNLDRVLRYEQTLADALVAATQIEHAQDLELAVGQGLDENRLDAGVRNRVTDGGRTGPV